jgi:8-oxo-dGTP pyrophosphatase MutT (NUDIX family)
MIRRKESLGYIDFIRGKYSIDHKDYIMAMMKQMTNHEKEQLRTTDFDTLWCDIWGKMRISGRYKTEETVSREKFNSLVSGFGTRYSLNELLAESDKYGKWVDPEWGFPKGRRSGGETDYECAVREFCEETGYDKSLLKPIHNVIPFEEIFTGSNYVSYKHKYFLMNMESSNTTDVNCYQRSEVSKMSWFSIDDCLKNIRGYNLEKKRVISKIDTCLRRLSLYQ